MQNTILLLLVMVLFSVDWLDIPTIILLIQQTNENTKLLEQTRIDHVAIVIIITNQYYFYSHFHSPNHLS